MSLWKLSESSVSFYCPVKSHWKQRAEKYCGSINSYFCLFNHNKHNFTEFCRNNYDFAPAGNTLFTHVISTCLRNNTFYTCSING